jgi:hypothetical protein
MSFIILQYLLKFDLAPVFNEEEFRHWFLPQSGIVDAYVVERNGKITGKNKNNKSVASIEQKNLLCILYRFCEFLHTAFNSDEPSCT